MALRFAIHQIHMGSKVVEARTVADFPENDDLDSLDDAGAVRKVTDAEEALYRLTNPDDGEDADARSHESTRAARKRGKAANTDATGSNARTAGVDDATSDL